MKLELRMRTENVGFERYREVYFSEAFNRLAISAANLRERELCEHEVLPDGRESRTVRVVPDIALPAAIKKLFGERAIEYRELTVFDPKTRSARLDIKSPARDLVKVGGDVRFVEERGGVTLHFQGEVRVRVFGLGAMFEKIIVSQVKERYAAIGKMLQRYLDAGASAQ
jgi:hypothetical protein